MPKIVEFCLVSSGKILPLPLVLFFCDMLVTTYLRIAFGTVQGFFLPRITGYKKSLREIIEEAVQ